MSSIFAVIPLLDGNSDAINQSNLRNFLAYIIITIILLPEKFLPFDWLRAYVFQLNLKYLRVKIIVTMVTQNH